ncbi:serine/arginine-rich SC35-like splicing factor SCL30A isoform X2 [Tanacetum coccineum]|uniref:Serine/arginine-rich SC35-like splicing factor SCL30A isoform X2 n=1 Tax=Tanacetum coccineum TaxID=301880 RepID=A0ABQ4ZN52_9ASTR
MSAALPVIYARAYVVVPELVGKFTTISWEPRGFGFVQFLGTADAAEAKYQMDFQFLRLSAECCLCRGRTPRSQLHYEG